MEIQLITFEYFPLETIGIGVKHIVIYIYIYILLQRNTRKKFEIPIDKWGDTWYHTINEKESTLKEIQKGT